MRSSGRQYKTTLKRKVAKMISILFIAKIWFCLKVVGIFGYVMIFDEKTYEKRKAVTFEKYKGMVVVRMGWSIVFTVLLYWLIWERVIIS